MNRTLKKILFWTPRIAGILFIFFISLFALDVFGTGAGFWQTLLALFMHLIPSIVLAIAIVVAWRQEWVGAVLFVGWAVFYLVSMSPRGFDWFSYALVAGLPALIGLFFLAGWIWREQVRTI